MVEVHGNNKIVLFPIFAPTLLKILTMFFLSMFEGEKIIPVGRKKAQKSPRLTPRDKNKNAEKWRKLHPPISASAFDLGNALSAKLEMTFGKLAQSDPKPSDHI